MTVDLAFVTQQESGNLQLGHGNWQLRAEISRMSLFCQWQIHFRNFPPLPEVFASLRHAKSRVPLDTLYLGALKPLLTEGNGLLGRLASSTRR